jgi:S1-C subfamily serine protease
MKPSRPFIVFCALLGAAVCNGQTKPKSPTQPKSPTSKYHGINPTVLPFDDARRMTVSVRIKGTFKNSGSAVWIGKSGYLATCYHVVKNVNEPLIVASV